MYNTPFHSYDELLVYGRRTTRLVLRPVMSPTAEQDWNTFE